MGTTVAYTLSINEIMVRPLYLGMDSKGHKRNYHHLTLGFHVSIESRLPGPTVSIQAIELRARNRVKNREIRARVPGNGSRGLAPAPQPGLSAGKSPSMSSRTVNQRGKTGSWNVRSTAGSPVISHLHDLKRTYKLGSLYSIDQEQRIYEIRPLQMTFPDSLFPIYAML